MPRPRLPRRAILIPLLPAAVLLALLPLVTTRIPKGSLGATAASGLLPPGWHLKRPGDLVLIVPLAGRLESVDVDRTTAEGAALRLRLSLGYRLDPEHLGARAAALASRGLESLVADLARDALSRRPAARLADLAASSGPPAPIPPALVRDISDTLQAAGIVTTGLEARAGLPGSFAPQADARVTRAPTGLRLVFVGLDGADWRIIDPLMKAGRLPTLARLVANGARAPLRSYDPMISPLLWTTMVTGVGPDRHGIADFQAVESGTGRHIPISSRFRKVPALWNIFTSAGVRSGFVAWWASYPAEEVDGWQVSNLVAFETMRPASEGHAAPAGLTWPPTYLSELRPRLLTAADLDYDEILPLLKVSRPEFESARDEVLRPPSAGQEKENRKAAQQPVPLAISIVTGSRNYAAIASDLAAKHVDLTAVYFEGIDMMGHRFQHCMPPRMAICPEDEYARYSNAVTGFYVMQDALIGSILKAAGEEATVMVVSDHGFRSGSARPADIVPFTTQQPVEWHDPEGIFILSGPGASKGTRLAERPTLFDIAPTLLYLTGLPASQEMPGHPLLTALDPAFVAAHPARSIAAYPPESRSPGAHGAPEDSPDARQAEADLLASLRALGYIGGDEGAPEVDQREACAPSGAPQETGATTQVFYHRNLATYFMKRQDYAHAVEQLQLANQKQRLAKTYQMLSEAYLGMGRKADALRVLRESLDTLPAADAEPVLWLTQIQLGDPAGIAAAAADVARYAARTKAKPGLDDAIAGLLAESGGDTAKALASYERSFAADPLRTLVAQRLYALEPPARRAPILLPALSSAVARDPRLDEYHSMLGALLMEKGRTQEALEEFRRAADLDPENGRFAANLGGAYAQLGRWDEAAAAYERAASIAPSAAISLRLGSVYRRLKRTDSALAAFEQARAQGDDSPGPILGIALTQREMGRPSEARATLAEGLRRFPSEASLARLSREIDAGAKQGPNAAGMSPKN